jgi:hypothetical protein
MSWKSPCVPDSVCHGLAAVGRAQGGRAQHIDRLVVLRVDEELNVVPRALHESRLIGDLAPALAGVRRHVQAARILHRIALDERVDLVGIRSADGNRHLAHVGGQAFGHLLPRLAAVD